MKFNYQSYANKSGIYKITNTHTNRIYIGQAKSFKKRWYQHSVTLKANKHANPFLQKDYNKCKEELGHDDFLIFEVLEVMEGSTKQQRTEREQVYIDQNFDNKELCYNLQKKASIADRSCFSKTPEETKKKLSDSSKLIWKSKPEDEKREIWDKISAAQKLNSEFYSEQSKKLWEDEEYKKKVLEKSQMTFKTEEYKKKQSESQKKRWTDEAYKAKVSEERKKMWADEEFKAKRAEALKNPEVKQKSKDSAKKRFLEGRNEAFLKHAFKPKPRAVLDPSGNEIVIENIKQFCIENNFDYLKFRKIFYSNSAVYQGYKNINTNNVLKKQ